MDYFSGTGPRYVELSGLMKGGNTMEMNYKYQLDFWTPENADAAYPSCFFLSEY